MTWQHTRRSKQDYDGLQPQIRKAFDKQVRLLAADLRHRSLRAKKYDESRDLWQARVTKDWRFYFVIQNDTCIVTRIIPHPK